MRAYIIRRLLLVIPTLFGIMLINFALTQFVPGGPVQQVISSLRGQGDVLRNITSNEDPVVQAPGDLGAELGGALGGIDEQTYRGAQGLPEDFIRDLEVQFGFDKPAWKRFFIMIGNYLRFDFGESYFRSVSVVDLVVEKLPVSITLGLWSTLIAYLISIPLGIRKAVRNGSSFDRWSSGVIICCYSIPAFLFAILLLVLFVGGSYWKLFPLRGLTSDGFEDLSLWGKIIDYLWHITLPVLVSSLSGFATLTLLTKNTFLEEIGKQYVITARAKGASERRVLYVHVFRNAMLIVISGFPALLLSVLFGSSLIIETLFSLDGLGRLGFEAALQRDYPVIFGTLYVFGLTGLLLGIISDLTYVWIDPRIDFESQGTRL